MVYMLCSGAGASFWIDKSSSIGRWVDVRNNLSAMKSVESTGDGEKDELELVDGLRFGHRQTGN